jgi:haloacid dehalogenase superfamily, subfamily IA, variant 3 with third motif having DD or ED/haloacid dehalogenase superfamily, subfamily IA, variant 1 with third motif having Dx(3-4)D or Dx(3-4)E
MDQIKAVILDLDQTVLDRTRTFRAFAASFINEYFFHHHGRDELVEDMMVRDEDGYKDKRELFSEVLTEYPWAGADKPELEQLMDYYKVNYVNNAILMDQGLEVLEYLRKKYQTGLITNGRTDIQYGKIDRMGIRGHFDIILVSEEAGVKKPDAVIFRMALQALGLSPEQCVYVGDHPVNDVAGAANVGMKTIWLQSNQPWREELNVKPDHVIRSLQQLMEIL